jgi:Flp pilus assembly pilin Flp
MGEVTTGNAIARVLGLRVSERSSRISITSMKAVFWEFWCSDDGQDMVEYAFLTGFVAIVGALAFNALEAAIRNGYISWDTAEQNLWEPEDP